jgi:SAM-dependent methyltransferase
LKGKPLCTSSFIPRYGKGHNPPALSHLWQCPKCAFIFRDCKYSGGEIEKHFDRADYIELINEQTYRLYKGKMFERLARQTTKYFDFSHRRRLLVDFGCSYGHLGQTFQAAGWNVIGVDIAPSILEYHRKYGTFPVYPDLDTPQIPDGGVDAIAMMDVICYLENPIEILELAYKKLATPSVLLLRVPNRTHFIRWAACLQKVLPINLVRRFECDHKSYWSVKTVKLAAQKIGFDKVCIIHREKGYYAPWPRKILHWTTQLLSHLTCGAVDLSTVFHAQLWKGSPRSARED